MFFLWKGAVAAIHYMVTNAAKYDVDDKSFSQETQQLGLSKENSDVVMKHYRDAKDMLRNKFAEDSYRVSKLVAVDWRVDEVIASSRSKETTGEVKEASPSMQLGPLIHIKLQVDTKPECNEFSEPDEEGLNECMASRLKNIVFGISSEKLDVLIHELSHAQKLIQNMG